jgi:hypothetical protein
MKGRLGQAGNSQTGANRYIIVVMIVKAWYNAMIA